METSSARKLGIILAFFFPSLSKGPKKKNILSGKDDKSKYSFCLTN